MFRSLVTNKIALAVVALVPWIVGEVASLSCCGAEPAASTVAAAPEAPDSAPCLVYETASGRLVTVKAPASRIPGADCVRI